MPPECLVVLCHPRPGSLNHALAARAGDTLRQRGFVVHAHDLYAEGFAPTLGLAELQRGISFDKQVLLHTQQLEASAVLVFVHPEWWGQPPALLKGWLDRVLRPDVAYELEGEEFTEKRLRPLLGAKRAAVFCTTDRPGPSAAPATSAPLASAATGEIPLLERIWHEGIFPFCGIRLASVSVFHDVRRSTPAQRGRWLQGVEETIGRLLDSPAPGAPP